jgi:hypothetical protein
MRYMETIDSGINMPTSMNQIEPPCFVSDVKGLEIFEVRHCDVCIHPIFASRYVEIKDKNVVRVNTPKISEFDGVEVDCDGTRAT